MNGLTHYELLGIGRDADQATIRAAYRQKMRLHHPDQSGQDDGGVMAQALNEAYSVLSDMDLRAHYDSSLGREQPGEVVTWDMPEMSGRPVRVAERIFVHPPNPLWLLILIAILFAPFLWGIWYYGYR